MGIDPELLADARELLNRARMIAEVPAAQAGEIGHGHQDSSPPSGIVLTKRGIIRQRSTLETLGERINRAIATGSDHELRAANQWATVELKMLQHGPDRSAETREQFEYRVISDYEGQPASFVARKELTSITTVRKIRVADGRDPARGRKAAGEGGVSNGRG